MNLLTEKISPEEFRELVNSGFYCIDNVSGLGFIVLYLLSLGLAIIFMIVIDKLNRGLFKFSVPKYLKYFRWTTAILISILVYPRLLHVFILLSRFYLLSPLFALGPCI